MDWFEKVVSVLSGWKTYIVASTSMIVGVLMFLGQIHLISIDAPTADQLVKAIADGLDTLSAFIASVGGLLAILMRLAIAKNGQGK